MSEPKINRHSGVTYKRDKDMMLIMAHAEKKGLSVSEFIRYSSLAWCAKYPLKGAI